MEIVAGAQIATRVAKFDVRNAANNLGEEILCARIFSFLENFAKRNRLKNKKRLKKMCSCSSPTFSLSVA